MDHLTNLPPTRRQHQPFVRATLLLALILCSFYEMTAQNANLMIRDDVNDLGAEPNSTATVFYASPDIWVRQNPIPGYSPQPFSTTSPPSWISNFPHQAAEWRDPTKYSKPNWVYVKITNTSSQDSSEGGDTIKVYWAKASTGLNWPAHWDDYITSMSGCTATLYGEELTKTRKDAALVTVSERQDLIDAMVAIDTIYYPDTVSWWDKQDKIHEATHVHGGPVFLPWHRELINRYELLLRGVKPWVRLHYWDWTTDPTTTSGGRTNLMDTTTFGQSNGMVTYPFHSTFSTDGPIYRSKQSGAPSVSSDASISTTGNNQAQADQYQYMRWALEGNHNTTHGYIGGTIGNPHTAFQDPFVYLLHSNVDRIFAMWQRSIDQSHLYRLDSGSVYGNETANGSNFWTSFYSPGTLDTLRPWGGLVSPLVVPWDNTNNEIMIKQSIDRSVVYPPFYDNVQAVVPVLQPGESVVLEFPWYPPHPDDYSCFNADKSHFCLLARIISPDDPMNSTYPEGTTTWLNVKNQNNIAWKNITVLDNFVGQQMIGQVTTRNVNPRGVTACLTFTERFHTQHNGTVKVDLGKELFGLWQLGGMEGVNVEYVEKNTIELTGAQAEICNIPLPRGFFAPINLNFTDVEVTDGTVTFVLDVEQYEVNVEGPRDFVGGERFEMPAKAHRKRALGVKEREEMNNSLILYPNPAENTLTIEMDGDYQVYRLRLIDMTGKEHYTGNFNRRTVLDIGEFAKGMYFVEVISKETGVKVVRPVAVR